MQPGRQVFYVAVGEAAKLAAEASCATLCERGGASFQVTVLSPSQGELTPKQASRWAKVSLDQNASREHALYLDADTFVRGDLSAGFELLEDGFDLVIVPSAQQGDDCLWHIQPDEREATIGELGYLPLQLQFGVFFVAWNERTRRLWSTLRNEYLRYRDEDQAALLRALAQVPVKVWMLGFPFNGGAVIEHRHGTLRRVQ